MLKFTHIIATLALAGVLPLALTAQEKADRKLTVKVNYTGSGTVDAKHKIIVFLFDSPDFANGGVMPFAAASTDSKKGVVKFENLSLEVVYAAAVYDPTGGYDGESGPPPSGSSLGIYSTEPGRPAAVKLENGKVVEVDLPFDDTTKMP